MTAADATQQAAQRRSVAFGFAAACVVVICWSGFNIVSRLGGRSVLTPFDLAALRCGVAAIFTLPFFLRMRFNALPAQLLAIAVLGGIGYSLLAYSGFTLAPAAHAGVLVNGGIPAATALIAWSVFGYQLNRRAIVSLLIAGVGIALIGYQSLTHAVVAEGNGPQWLGDLFFIAAAVCYACFGLLVRRWNIRPLEAMVAVTLFAAVIYLPIYALFLPQAWQQASTDVLLLQALYQGVVAAMVASVCFAYAAVTIGPMKASLMLALVPGISALAAVPLLGEELTLLIVLGVMLVTAGAILGATNPTGAVAQPAPPAQ